ncbi:NTP transferase domain-containing protein [Paraburkholderia sp. Cy-641]|uniref:sugar phosphate nucleotidyltransferase n=1 Tax=Paraburkholderia sp. Cy-641 TaxID=2608337 RepID=UPI001422448F|nr:sugar phosphate nucleotidyltransferase [Paraburkholderia sp. Cy-641]NIF76624.1 NTP transferase domain-containing protein [Paraburkholderia sp. Cy-641]
MRAIILAGGKGTRLRPYTTLIPKPLVPLGGKYSILEIIIMQLAKTGVTHITLAVNHLSHLIVSYFGNGERYGLKIDYSLEEKELSTIGPLTLINDLPDNFIVMNGDILCDLDYRGFFDAHVSSGSQISVSAYRREVKIDFGVLRYNESRHLTAFEEKPTIGYDVSMGIYCINRAVIEALPRGAVYGFDNLMLDGIKNQQKIDIRQFNGFWLDIGRPDDYQYADEHFPELAGKLGVS